MAELMGGFEAREFDAASLALGHVRSDSDIVRLIKTQPVFVAPLFHAYLRQRRLQLDAPEFRGAPARDHFMQVYDLLFMLLHERAHAHEPAEPPAPPAATAEPLGPAMLLGLMRQCAGRLPPESGSRFEASRHAGALAADMAQWAGHSVTLLPHAPLAGALFALLRLRCARCDVPRLALRAYAVDLEADPAWLGHLQTGRTNADRCPRCGASRAAPQRVWVSDSPPPPDPLAALSCLLRRSASERIYLTPPGSTRRPDNDRIHEIRLESIARQLGPPWAHGDAGPVVHTDGVAYGVDELLRRVSETGSLSHEHLAQHDLVQQLCQKLASGQLPYRDAEQYLRRIAGPLLAEWPLQVAEGGEPVPLLVHRLVFEACAAARGLPAAARAVAAGGVSQAYARLGEVALAEMALARARDLAHAAAGPATDGADLQTMLAAAEESLLIASGEMEAAARLGGRLLQSSALQGDSDAQRLVRAELSMNQALAARARGELAQAWVAMREGVQAFMQLAERLATIDPAAAARARQGASGSLANLAGVHTDMADGMALLAALGRCGGRFAQLDADSRATLGRLGSAERLLQLQRELADRLPALLEPGLQEPAALRERALSELQQAIGLAESVADHEYLGIQWLQRASLLSSLQRDGEARLALQRAAAHAARAGDDARGAAVAWAQALDAVADGDTGARLAALERCLRAEMRRSAKGGRAPRSLAHLAGLALEAGDQGEPAARAVAIAEGCKRLVLAQAMTRGPALSAAAAAQAAAGLLQALQAEREQLRLAALWQAEPDPAQRARAATLEPLIVEARAALAQRDPHYAAWHDATFLEPGDAARLRSGLGTLGAGAAWLGFEVDGAVGYAYLLWQGGCDVRTQPLDSALRQALAAGDMAAEPALLHWTGQLLAKLEQRLALLKPDDRLLISPCQMLEQVAFAALPSGAGLLCERATLSVLHGAGMFEACLQRPLRGWRKAACLGDPARPDRPRLDHARAEVTELVTRLRAAGLDVADALTGAAATVPALAEAVRGCDLLHLACHALPPDAMHRAGRLLLAPSPLKQDSGELGDDRIVADLTLEPGALAVLAGCASGVFGAAQRFLDHGLVPAWLVAGAGAVLGSLVPIDDAAAADFHAAFYRHLLAGRSPAAALAATQRQALRGELGAVLQQRPHWAAYVLYGIG